GLGTSTKDDAIKYFKAMSEHRIPFSGVKEGDREMVDMAFSKKKIEDRKEWLRKFQPGTYMDHKTKSIKVEDFVNKELILFSVADNVRSIPSVVDGFKPGQRKIIYACFKRNLKSEVKVNQLSGYVSEHTAYHHGEVSLSGTIINLAQDFVGSNNINLLMPNGQFGSRFQGGKDNASPRYIFTLLSPLARKLFRIEDDNLLKYLNEDGQDIEPEYYIPIIPMTLINGAEGIGTGWSTFVPNYNPIDLVENIKRMINGKEIEKMHPWYKGFKGVIEQVDVDKYKINGIIKKINETSLEISELPIKCWTQNYKEYLESLIENNTILSFKEYHKDENIKFVINLTREQLSLIEKEGLEKKFKMSVSLSCGNLVCFDSFGRLKKYLNVEEIIKEFYNLRLIFYQKRKEYLSNQLLKELSRLENKARFILELINETLVIKNKLKINVEKELQSKDYEKDDKEGNQ
ncbi:DNA topoisomerase II, partial [Rozella allomycis CSF55]